jgi:hypothetical protein
MKTVRTLALLAASAFLLLASGAQAQPAAPYLPGYFTLMGGGYIPEGDLNTDHYDANTGFVGLLTFGYQVNPFFGLQTDLGYLETSGNNNLQVSAIPVAVSFKFGIPIAFFEPYALGGAGVYFASTETEFLNDNSVEFGVHAGGGVNFNFGGFQIGAEARYLWLEANNLNVDGLLVMGKIGSRF